MGQHFEDLGKLLLRLAVGGLMLFHGYYKLAHGVDPIVGLLTAKGLPPALKYGVYVGEVVAPALILIGFLTRIAGLLVAADMTVAVDLAHGGDLFKINEQSGGLFLELQLFYFLGGLALFFLGGGKFALWRRGGPLG